MLRIHALHKRNDLPGIELLRRLPAEHLDLGEDFDAVRQEEVWRLLSADRDRLLTFARRHAITIGKLEVRKTLKSPQPVYELIATGRDARSVREYLGFERSQR